MLYCFDELFVNQANICLYKQLKVWTIRLPTDLTFQTFFEFVDRTLIIFD